LKLLVTGASGLLGNKVVQFALRKEHDVYAVYREHVATSGVPIKLDLTDYEKLRKLIFKIRPDVIIHAAAYTDVDGCELNRDLAWKINAEITKYLAMTSASVGSHLIYISTDYVFDGEKGLYKEGDKPNPVNYYGYTKLMGEEFVKEYAEKWCIARTSVIYGLGPSYKQNFATWLINNLREEKEVKVLTDQYVSPTLNTNLAEMLLEIAERKMTGIFHTAGADRVSRYKFAIKLSQVFNLNKNLIKPAKINDIQWRAKRPRDSSLDVSKALAQLNLGPKRLDQALNIMKNELVKYE